MMNLSIRTLLVSTAIAVALATAPAADALTLLEAVDAAIARSPEVAGLSSQVEVQRAREELAGRSGQPQIGLDTGAGAQYSNLLGRGEATQFRRDVGARLSQRLWDWQRTGQAVEAARLRAEAAELDVRLARERVAFLTAEAYLNALRSRLSLKMTQENITFHRWLIDVAKERVAKNQLAKARLTELQARLAPLEVERMDLQAELDRATATLVELAGSADNLSMPPALPASARPAPDVDALLRGALPEHPAMRRSELLVSAADKSLASARSGYWPALDANLSSRYLADAEGIRGLQWDNQALVRLNWPLYGEDTPAQVREAEAARRVAEAQQAQARQEIALDVMRYSTTLRALQDKQKILSEYQAVSKFSMEAGMEYIRRTTRFGTDMLALADLINVRYHAEANVVTNRVDHVIAELRLLQAAGKLLPTLESAYRRPVMPAQPVATPSPAPIPSPIPRLPLPSPARPSFSPAPAPSAVPTPQPTPVPPRSTPAPQPTPASPGAS